MPLATLVAIILLSSATGLACPDAAGCVRAAAEAYRAGRFANALDLFREAQVYGSEPTVAWNIANLLAELGRHREAMTAFDAFVESWPEDPRVPMAERKRALAAADDRAPEVRVEVDGPPGAAVRIDEHRGVAPFAATVHANAPLRIAVEASPPASPDLALDLPGWIALGTGAAIAVGSSVLLAYADHEAERLEALELRALRRPDEVDIRDIRAAQDAADRGRTAGLVLGGVSIAAITAGGLLLALDVLGGPEQPTIRVGPTGAATSWHF